AAAAAAAAASASNRPAAAPPAVEPVPEAEHPAVARHGTVGLPGTHRAPPAPWPARVRAGEFRDVIAEAERRGIDGVLREESAPNLMALADAARYAGSSPLARRALTEV